MRKYGPLIPTSPVPINADLPAVAEAAAVEKVPSLHCSGLHNGPDRQLSDRHSPSHTLLPKPACPNTDLATSASPTLCRWLQSPGHSTILNPHARTELS